MFAGLITLAAIAAFASSAKSAAGKWKLDLGKSSYVSMPAPKVELLMITKDEPKAIQWRLTGASPDGKTYTESYDGPVDGQYHALTSSEADMTVAYTRAANSDLHWTVKDKSGAVIESGAGHLSADGKTLTLKGAVHAQSGKSQFVSVFTKSE